MQTSAKRAWGVRANAGVYKQTPGMVQRARAGTGGARGGMNMPWGGTNERTQGERGGCERARTNADGSGDTMWPPSLFYYYFLVIFFSYFFSYIYI